jgi:hypothetical protein
MSDNATGIRAMLAKLSRLDRDGRVIRPIRPPFPVNTKLKQYLKQQKENND